MNNRITRAWWLSLLLFALVGCRASDPGTTAIAPGPADVPFADLIADPDGYHGTKLCTAGVYLAGFEASALGASTEERSGSLYLNEPAIWIEQGSAVVTRGECSTTDTVPEYEFCEATVCGTFETGGQFGHLGGYQYQIR